MCTDYITDPVTSVGHDDRVKSLVVSPNGKWAASASDDSTIILWAMNGTTGGRIAQQWVAHGYMEVLSLVFSPDSRHLLSSGEDGKAAVWELDEGVPVRSVAALKALTSSRVSHCAWSPDGSMVASGYWDGTILLWDARTFLPLHTLVCGTTKVELLVFSPDGRWLFSASNPSDYCVWDTAWGRLYWVLESRWQAIRSIWNGSRPLRAAFHPGSMYVAASCGVDLLDVWDIATGQSASISEHCLRGEDVSFSADGELLLAVQRRANAVWDFFTCQQQAHLSAEPSVRRAGLADLSAEPLTLRRACFSPCGRYIVSLSGSNCILLHRRTKKGWDTNPAMLQYEQAVEHVAFSVDGKTVVSGTADGSILFRRTRDIFRSPRKSHHFRPTLGVTVLVKSLYSSIVGAHANEPSPSGSK